MVIDVTGDTRRRFRKAPPIAVAALAILGVTLLWSFGGWGNDAETAGPSEAALASQMREPAREGAVRVARDPADVPAPVGDRRAQEVVLELTAVELDGWMTDGITFTYWTFDGTVPGPLLRVRVGDTVTIRLHNAEDSTQPHSIDLH